jgi:hypothetical protein
MKSDFITACPYCYAKNPNGQPNFLEYDPEKPGIVICQACGEMKAEEVLEGPKFYFTHYEEPGVVK